MTIWEREKERQKLWQLFERGKHVALFAPRRLGKTWLMRKLEEDAKARNITAVFVDLEAETTALGAVRRICKEISEKKFFLSLWQQLGKRVTDILQGDTPANTYQELLLKSNWESMLNATLKALNSADRPSLILIDEISVCLSSLLAVDEIQGRAFMRRLREHQQQYPNIRWLLTGSIGIDHVADQYGLGGTLNLLDPFPLAPLTPKQATAFVNDLCGRRNLPKPDKNGHDLMHTRLGWLAPHYLSGFLDRIEDEVPEGMSITAAHIDQAFDTLLRHPFNRIFSDWPDHINRNYPDQQKLMAHAVLNILSCHPDGESLESLRNNEKLSKIDITGLRNTIVSLENDGFISKASDTGQYRFVFGLLREYWRRYQCL